MIFFSDGYGRYQINAFAASIDHPIDYSKEVFSKFSGGYTSEFSVEWSNSTDEEKAAFLTEHHEIAHHSLLHSTSVGILLWRINQIIFRDIHFLSDKLQENNVVIPHGSVPRVWLKGRCLSSEFSDPRLGEYCEAVVNAIEDLTKLKEILFHPAASTKYSDYTLTQFSELMNRCFEYIAARCGLPWNGNWCTELPPSTKLFNEELSFNARDMFEVHAIARELWIMRAFNDFAGLSQRIESACDLYGDCFTFISENFEKDDEVGFYINPIQEVVLLACSSGLDITACDSSGMLRVEDHIPWWRLKRLLKTDEEINSPSINGEYFILSLQHCGRLSESPIHTQNSNWTEFHARVGDMNIEKEIKSVISLGTDVLIHFLKNGVSYNANYLANTLENGPTDEGYRKWYDSLYRNICLIEYEDEVWFNSLDSYADAFESFPIMQLNSDGFSYLTAPYMPIIGIVLVSTLVNSAICAYEGNFSPKVQSIVKKLKKSIVSEMANYKIPNATEEDIKMYQDFIKMKIDIYLESAVDRFIAPPFSGRHSIFSDNGNYY